MGLFNLFSGKTAADFERQGDTFARRKSWGEAKLAFESALAKIEKASPVDPMMRYRLGQKLNQIKEALAQDQQQEALQLLEAGCVKEALELFVLAIELTNNARLKEALNLQIQAAREQLPDIGHPAAVFRLLQDQPEPNVVIEDGDDHFTILLGALPEQVQQAYQSYGYHFKQGYLALNQGAFGQAVTHLTRASEENPSPQSLVPLELATAYMNLGQATSARPLLEALVQNQPDLLPALQLLCEVYWEEGAFDKAMALLDALSPDLAQSMSAFLLRGETLLQSDRNEEAQSFFMELMETYGWNETVALGLANAHEKLGRTSEARNVYGQMISQCSGCGSRIDPAIKRKYADLSIASGDFSTKVLEYYLALSQEDPANAVHYCRNISQIYTAQGYEAEARRFQAIADDLAQKQILPDGDGFSES